MVCSKIKTAQGGFLSYIWQFKERLYTRDRMIKWGMASSSTCPLCENEDADKQHLLFKCSTSSIIWQKGNNAQAYTTFEKRNQTRESDAVMVKMIS